MDCTKEIKSIIAEETFYKVERRMESFLSKAHTLTQYDLELLMASYAYGGANRKVLREKYPGIEKIEKNPNKMNQFVGKNYLPKHCVTFAKQYQAQISQASEPVREQFYKIFPLRWESAAEHDMFTFTKSCVKYVENAPRLPDRDSVITDNERTMAAALAAAGADYVIIAGTGVSIQMVEGVGRSVKAVKSWEDLVALLRQDIEKFIGTTLTAYFESWYPTAKDNALEPMVRGHMLHSMIKVYNLFNNTDIDYTRFIARVFHSVAPRDPVPALATALGTCNVPLATTNYDMLLEACLNRFEYNLAEQCCTKTDCDAVVKRETDKITPANYNHHVYHLHGVWHSKAELTLGVEYAYSDEAFKNSMRVLTTTDPTASVGLSTATSTTSTTTTTSATTSSTGTRSRVSKKRSFDTFSGQNTSTLCKPVVFIGTKSGVFDPHFLPWLRDSPVTHFILMRDNEFENMVATIEEAKLVDKLVPVVYGAKYEDLAVFVADKLPVRVV